MTQLEVWLPVHSPAYFSSLLVCPSESFFRFACVSRLTFSGIAQPVSDLPLPQRLSYRVWLEFGAMSSDPFRRSLICNTYYNISLFLVSSLVSEVISHLLPNTVKVRWTKVWGIGSTSWFNPAMAPTAIFGCSLSRSSPANITILSKTLRSNSAVKSRAHGTLLNLAVAATKAHALRGLLCVTDPSLAPNALK